MTDHKQDELLLDQLRKHGQQFLSLFSFPSPDDKKKRKRPEEHLSGYKIARLGVDSGEDEDEWLGFGVQEIDTSKESGDPMEDFDEDDGFAADSSSHPPDVIFFSDAKTVSESDTIATKSQMKAFMSSKVSKLREDTTGKQKQDGRVRDADHDRTNMQNDALLHKLIHTKLLSGSLNPELDMTPAQRRKALAGRVLEVSGVEKMGKGERAIREQERNKAAKHIREGIAEKQKIRDKKKLDEAKNLGNYHPTIKNLFDSSSSAPSSSGRKRERGLRMGVGRFNGGILTLSRGEISAVQGDTKTKQMGSRGRARRK